MKQVSTRTNVLLLTAFAMSVGMCVAVTKHLFISSCISFAASIVFSFLAVFSHVPREQRRGKIILLTACSAVSIMLFLLIQR